MSNTAFKSKRVCSQTFPQSRTTLKNAAKKFELSGKPYKLTEKLLSNWSSPKTAIAASLRRFSYLREKK